MLRYSIRYYTGYAMTSKAHNTMAKNIPNQSNRFEA